MNILDIMFWGGLIMMVIGIAFCLLDEIVG